jgi:glycosyltransferase involved in cell wall biosynthesis
LCNEIIATVTYSTCLSLKHRINTSMLWYLTGIRYIVLANIIDGYPSEFENFSDFLARESGEEVITISHPLSRRANSQTRRTRWLNGLMVDSQTVRRPNFPPLTYLCDIAFAPKCAAGDVWVTFNPFQAAIAVSKTRGNARVVFWAIDFVPRKSRFSFVNLLYRLIEKFMMKRIDLQIENSERALQARQIVTGIAPKESVVVPITIGETCFRQPRNERRLARRVVYFGSVDRRNGILFLVELIKYVCDHDERVSFDIIGDGPLKNQVSSELDDLVRSGRVVIWGYVAEEEVVVSILGSASIAIAPFDETPGSFTEYADPQKIKFYLAAGLPILLTSIPPNSHELVENAGCTVLSHDDGLGKWSSTILRVLESEQDYLVRSKLAYEYAEQFSRTVIYKSVLSSISV